MPPHEVHRWWSMSRSCDMFTKSKFALHWSLHCICQFIRRARYMSPHSEVRKIKNDIAPPCDMLKKSKFALRWSTHSIRQFIRHAPCVSTFRDTKDKECHSATVWYVDKVKFPLQWSTYCIRQFIRHMGQIPIVLVVLLMYLSPFSLYSRDRLRTDKDFLFS